MITAPGGSHAGVHPGVHSGVQPDVHPSTLACDLTCALASTLHPVRPDVHPGVHPEIPDDINRISCRKGLSAAQINIIGLLLAIGPTVTPYKQLSAELERVYSMIRSPGAVRRSVERLVNRGYLRRKQAKVGTSQGVTFTLIQEMLCPHIRSAGPCLCAPVHPAVHPGVHPDADFAPSILREKIDRNILSISSENSKRYGALLESLSEEDIAFHWPELARVGFGTVQIRQIMQRRAQVGETLEHIMQGLTYAEWELARQCMTTHKGEPVSTPLNWVFKILATQGYYPRPAAYISPAEQAERDREATMRREKEAYEARREAEADAWIASLTPDARQEILGPDNRIAIPAAVRLRQHFRQHIWPDREKEPGPQMVGHGEGGANSHEQ